MQIQIEHAKFWEVVATAIVAQATGHHVYPSTHIDVISQSLMQFLPREKPDKFAYTGNIYDRVYRDLEDSKKDESYPSVLATALGLTLPKADPLKLSIPQELMGTPLHKNAIVLAPFALRRDLEIPLVVWRHIARFGRSYGRPVLLLGDTSARLDIATFSEGDLLGRQSLPTILATLAAAEVLIGVPNEWLWLAGSMNVRTVLLYPDNVPPRRWYWIGGRSTVRAVFTPSNVQTPIILTTIRKVLEVL